MKTPNTKAALPPATGSSSYEDRLAAWKKKNGLITEEGEEIPAGEARMNEEDAQAKGNAYCWECGNEFPIAEMVIETNPYNQLDDDVIEEDGYIAAENRNRRCKLCIKAEDDLNHGIEPGQG
jgi:hypothetical protein